MLIESVKRREDYDKVKSERKLNVGGTVWIRIAGKYSKFEDVWKGL